MYDVRLWCRILFIWNEPRTNVSNTSGNAKYGDRVKVEIGGEILLEGHYDVREAL